MGNSNRRVPPLTAAQKLDNNKKIVEERKAVAAAAAASAPKPPPQPLPRLPGPCSGCTHQDHHINDCFLIHPHLLQAYLAKHPEETEKWTRCVKKFTERKLSGPCEFCKQKDHNEAVCFFKNRELLEDYLKRNAWERQKWNKRMEAWELSQKTIDELFPPLAPPRK